MKKKVYKRDGIVNDFVKALCEFHPDEIVSKDAMRQRITTTAVKAGFSGASEMLHKWTKPVREKRQPTQVTQRDLYATGQVMLPNNTLTQKFYVKEDPQVELVRAILDTGLPFSFGRIYDVQWNNGDWEGTAAVHCEGHPAHILPIAKWASLVPAFVSINDPSPVQ